MALVIKRQEKNKPQKSNEDRIAELETEIAKKDKIIEGLQEQVAFVQLAVDEIIFGGELNG